MRVKPRHGISHDGVKRNTLPEAATAKNLQMKCEFETRFKFRTMKVKCV